MPRAQLSDSQFLNIGYIYNRGSSWVRHSFIQELIAGHGSTVLSIGPRGGVTYGTTQLTPREYQSVAERLYNRGLILIEDRGTRKVHIRVR